MPQEAVNKPLLLFLLDKSPDPVKKHPFDAILYYFTSKFNDANSSGA